MTTSHILRFVLPPAHNVICKDAVPAKVSLKAIFIRTLRWLCVCVALSGCMALFRVWVWGHACRARRDIKDPHTFFCLVQSANPSPPPTLAE